MGLELVMVERAARWGSRVWDWARGRTKELATLKKRVAELESQEKEREEFNKQRCSMTYSVVRAFPHTGHKVNNSAVCFEAKRAIWPIMLAVD